MSSYVDRATSFNATIRASRLANNAAKRGDYDRARRSWHLACQFAWQTGGLSGASTGGKVLTVAHGGRSRILWAPSGV